MPTGSILSTYLGSDQYIVPGLFTVVPKHDRVTLPVETRVEVPAFFSRCLNCFRDGKTYRLHAGNGRYAFHHNIGEHFLLASQFPGHPEYWALVNGERVPCTGSKTPNPCVLNPDVIDIVTKHCQDSLAKQPQLLSVSRDGQRLRVSFYHATAVYGHQVSVCLSCPRAYEFFEAGIQQGDELVHPVQELLED